MISSDAKCLEDFLLTFSSATSRPIFLTSLRSTIIFTDPEMLIRELFHLSKRQELASYGSLPMNQCNSPRRVTFPRLGTTEDDLHRGHRTGKDHKVREAATKGARRHCKGVHTCRCQPGRLTTSDGLLNKSMILADLKKSETCRKLKAL